MNSTDAMETGIESSIAVQKERAIRAKMTYCKACEDYGVKTCPWESFSGYQDYVDGRINESELIQRAGDELRDLSETFGKYTVLEREESRAGTEEAEKRERAKTANKLYRKVCSESGLDQCFFNNFAAWSDYVQGKTDDLEFTERARLEVQKMRAAD